MSFFSKLFGDTAAAPIDAIGKIVDDIHTSGEEKRDAEIKLTEVSNSLIRLQAEITKREAAHRSIFVAGWRPAIGWVCAIGLLTNFIVSPLLSPWYEIAVADSATMMSLVLALTGVAGLRTVEKAKGLTR